MFELTFLVWFAGVGVIGSLGELVVGVLTLISGPEMRELINHGHKVGIIRGN